LRGGLCGAAGDGLGIYGCRDFTDPADGFRLVRWLFTRAWLTPEQPSLLFDPATARLIERQHLRAGSRGHRPRLRHSVADHQRMPGIVALVHVLGNVLIHLGFERCHQHATSASAYQRVKIECGQPGRCATESSATPRDACVETGDGLSGYGEAKGTRS
jgi:hypothetical protein